MRCAPLRARARFFPAMLHDAARVSASALRPPAARSVVAADGLRDHSTPPSDRRPARAPPPLAPTPPRAAPRPRTPATLRIIPYGQLAQAEARGVPSSPRIMFGIFSFEIIFMRSSARGRRLDPR